MPDLPRLGPLLLAPFCAIGAAHAAPADVHPLEAARAVWSSVDTNGDGAAEIEALEPLTAPPPLSDAPLVVVLVEDRLLAPLEGSDASLRPSLDTYAADLAADGFRPWLLSARLYRGPRHQDGRTLLALRSFLQAVKERDSALAGVVLVGVFPDAFLVRTCNWIKKTPIAAGGRRWTEPVPYLKTRPEAVAHRFDLVLADLDGAWAERYVEPRTKLPWTVGVFPDGVPAEGGVPVAVKRGQIAFEDFFHVNDGVLDERGDAEETAPRLTPRWDLTDAECAPADLERKNPLARPELSVSRIDARPVARSPRRDVVGIDGEGLLDAEGRPQAVRFASPKQVPHWRSVWAFDPLLERRLLREYFARNHRFRRGYVAHAGFRPGSISHGLPSGMKRVRRGHPGWSGFSAPGHDVRRGTATQVVEWLKRPMALRTYRAHSDRWGAAFRKAPLDGLHQAAGGVSAGPPWSWSPAGDRLVPSLAASTGGGKVDFFLLRTLYANGIRPSPAIWLHTGCEAISPGGAERRPWHHPGYGSIQHAQGLLFYGGAVALVGRAKVFYDEPRGFSRALAAGETVGEAWARYFEVESRGPTFGRVGGRIGRKRSYFWSVLGDWTLRLREPPRYR